MKKIYFLAIAITSLLLAACSVGNTSKSGGVDNKGFLQFVQSSPTSYSGGVTVYVDNETAFIAKVNKKKPLRISENAYAVKTGTRHLKVVYGETTLYEKDIIVANQETKQISLP